MMNVTWPKVQYEDELISLSIFVKIKIVATTSQFLNGISSSILY
jgi:hypothetical protein